MCVCVWFYIISIVHRRDIYIILFCFVSFFLLGKRDGGHLPRIRHTLCYRSARRLYYSYYNIIYVPSLSAAAASSTTTTTTTARTARTTYGVGMCKNVEEKNTHTRARDTHTHTQTQRGQQHIRSTGFHFPLFCVVL